MSIENAGVILNVIVLLGIGVGFIGLVIIFLNNMIYKYWKPLNWYGKYFNFNEGVSTKPSSEETILDKEPSKQ